MRQEIADRAGEFAQSVELGKRRHPAETLPLEVLPLLDALRFLERNAARILRCRRLGMTGRPLWLTGVSSTLHRDPWGTVLVIAPFNYPLFLPGVQIMQALAAGNSVLVKPSPGHSAPMRLLADCLRRAGLPEGAMTLLGESVADAEQAIDRGVDKIVLTGSVAAGQAVLRRAAERCISCTVELSGNDPVFILPGANLDLAAKAIAYGLALNGGATCIAPRRIYIGCGKVSLLLDRLVPKVEAMPVFPVAPATLAKMERLLQEPGGRIIGGAISPAGMTPALVIDPPPDSPLLYEDIFAPVACLIPVDGMEQALAFDRKCPYRLAASVFGPKADAERFALEIDAGCVTINDLIVPTADPRIPFEGRGASGFGATRGEEGLLQMTRPRAVIAKSGNIYPHLSALTPHSRDVFMALVGLLHGRRSIRNILRHCLTMIDAVKSRQ